MITADELKRIPQMLAGKTASVEEAEDAMHDAIVRILERGEPLTGAKVHRYAKFTTLEVVRHEASEHRFLSRYMTEHRYDDAPQLYVDAKRKIGRPPRRGGVPALDLVACPICSTPFKPYSKNRRKQRTCGAPTCVSRMSAQTRRENREALIRAA